MTGRLRGWEALSWHERGRLLAMTVALPLIAISLKWFGYIRTRHWLERWSTSARSRRATPPDLQSAERLALLADIAGRHGPIGATCLRQSLLVYWLLRRRGLAPEFKIGVRRQDAVMDAHAWVELESRPLGQTKLAHTPFT